MDGEVLMFAQVMTVIVMSTASFVAIGLGARVLWRMGSRTKPREASAVDAASVQRLELGMDAIAIEVERIAEAQRYMVSLMSDRQLARAERPELRERENTPH